MAENPPIENTPEQGAASPDAVVDSPDVSVDIEATAGGASPTGSPEPGAAAEATGDQGSAQAIFAKSSELVDTAQAGNGQPLDMKFILDIPLKVAVEVGRTRLLVEELLQLGQGSVIELDKQMGEPFEVMVNEKLVARGEIVVVNDRFGVRLTDIISQTERVQQLG